MLSRESTWLSGTEEMREEPEERRGGEGKGEEKRGARKVEPKDRNLTGHCGFVGFFSQVKGAKWHGLAFILNGSFLLLVLRIDTE